MLILLRRTFPQSVASAFNSFNESKIEINQISSNIDYSLKYNISTREKFDLHSNVVFTIVTIHNNIVIVTTVKSYNQHEIAFKK